MHIHTNTRSFIVAVPPGSTRTQIHTHTHTHMRQSYGVCMPEKVLYTMFSSTRPWSPSSLCACACMCVCACLPLLCLEHGQRYNFSQQPTNSTDQNVFSNKPPSSCTRALLKLSSLTIRTSVYVRTIQSIHKRGLDFLFICAVRSWSFSVRWIAARTAHQFLFGCVARFACSILICVLFS